MPGLLTQQIVTADLRANRHHIGYRGEYQSHPHQSPEPPAYFTTLSSPTSHMNPMPTPSQIDPMDSSNTLTIAERESIALEAQNQADIANAKYRARQTYQENHPKSTKINYNIKQKLWAK